VAVTDVHVLLRGEKGTVMSLAAHVIHELSPRHKDPFTEINCGFTPDDGVIGNALLGKGAPVASCSCPLFVRLLVFFSNPLEISYPVFYLSPPDGLTNLLPVVLLKLRNSKILILNKTYGETHGG